MVEEEAWEDEEPEAGAAYEDLHQRSPSPPPCQQSHYPPCALAFPFPFFVTPAGGGSGGSTPSSRATRTAFVPDTGSLRARHRSLSSGLSVHICIGDRRSYQIRSSHRMERGWTDSLSFLRLSSVSVAVSVALIVEDGVEVRASHVPSSPSDHHHPVHQGEEEGAERGGCGGQHQ